MKRFFLVLVLTLVAGTAWAEEGLSIFEKKFTECENAFDIEYKKCPESWSTSCYHQLLKANQNAQKCYKQVAVDLLVKFYGQSEKQAEGRFDTFSKFVYDQYLFVFSETNYCKKNNCGIGLYLYSEYTTTEQLHNFVNKIIKSISVNINND